MTSDHSVAIMFFIRFIACVVDHLRTLQLSRRSAMQSVLKLVYGNLKARKQGYDHLNREGAPSYGMSLKEQVVNVLVTGTLGDTFYASSQQLAEEAMMVLCQARQE